MLHMSARAGEGMKIYWPPLGKDMEAFDSMMERAAFVDLPKSDLKAVASRLYASSNTPDPRQAKARVCYWKGWVMIKDNPDSALTLARRALALCDSARYPYDHARFSLLVGEYHRYKGNYSDAYFIYHDKLERLRKAGDEFWAAKTMVYLGVIFQNLGEYSEASRYFNLAQDLFKKTGSMACRTKNRINLANISYLLGDKKKSLAYLKDLETNGSISNDSIYVANVYVSRFHISDFTDTLAARRAYSISQRIHDENLAVISTMAVGITYLNDNNNLQAISFFRNAYRIADRLGDFPNKKQLLEYLERCYAASGRPDSAEMCRNEILILNDSIYYRESISKLKRAEYLSVINGYEQSLLQQRKQNRMRILFTMSLVALLSVVLILALWLLRVTRRKNASERRLQEEEKRRLELLNRQYSIEIGIKEKELASHSMMLTQKNAKLKELADRLMRIEMQGDKDPAENQMLNERISNELSNDDWKYFKLQFEKVHPLFFSSLTEAYPSLSKTELRLCAYIRVGMSAKEIAQVLSVRPDTVNTSRYRIRRKLKLDPQESLEAVLEKF